MARCPVYPEPMNVSELAAGAGVAPSAVRFYERTGVLPRARRRPNGYRAYGADDLARLRLVVTLRRIGLDAHEAGRLATLCVEGVADSVARDLVGRIGAQRNAIARQRAELDQLEAELVDLELTARMTVQQSAATAADDTPRPSRVIFICTGNSARSQLAEALLSQFGGPEFEALSAGTHPCGVHPLTIEVLAEVGIDWSAARSKSVDEVMDQEFDYVITVCDRARQACPAFPGEHDSLHWGLDDPAEPTPTAAEQFEAFRRARSDLSMRLRPFIELARYARRTIRQST